MQRSCNHPSADTQPLPRRRRRAFRRQPVLGGLAAVADESQNLIPIAEVISDTTLRIELTTGMEIGDGQTLVVDLVG